MRANVALLIGLLCGVPTLANGQNATATERYLLQERCGKQAAAAFAKDYVANETTKDGQHRTFNYENHYSQKLNKCFFLEVGVFIEKGKWSKQLRLFDLNENKEYGNYYDSDASPTYVFCVVNEMRCSSEKEWRQLAKPYLED
ncbi:hypothetical protein JQ557_23290 [Bradyrhizobium sp. U87765 SZCCT0131]|uniref:hypothetical protein n=1 Tax=unclassified Bradyrhizobium TaxID=2631580 RepID=UPI001BA59A74|nr:MULTISPECIES: hypothetical protein [unclassified Bradyrhizobium]MBR1220943.1 hypothetical protein [Bradyrhizobium sp. U87765 SZCCT0131]MBR1260237.1 hypothetical protein [Bradyrhizobium sp. U87765 SZCCT0134]MBR1307514.1 hypothetical protein [Bradyrhizobium sp. U87765 SZCCT0110]MBR1321468.1 hypothetical protein [Bradyrhizobium sp. U87765 SZCCT0109]MBR1349781.1 hypothetical protein [Bradyrhizobium sp. U87765 SZCCT0048]